MAVCHKFLSVHNVKIMKSIRNSDQSFPDFSKLSSPIPQIDVRNKFSPEWDVVIFFNSEFVYDFCSF